MSEQPTFDSNPADWSGRAGAREPGGRGPGGDIRRLPTGAATATIETETIDVARREIRVANEHDVILGNALAKVERERAFVPFGHASAAHWAVHVGLERGRANELLNLGRLLHILPEMEVSVLAGETTPQSAAVVGRLIEPTPILAPKEEPDPAETAARDASELERARSFSEYAKTLSKHRLERLVHEERERIKQGERVVPLTFHVKQSTKDNWALARKIARRHARRSLSDGEAFSFVIADFLKRYDKDGLSGQRKTGSRRMGATSERPDDRTVPAEVHRQVMQRAHGHCEFPGCPNGTFVQLCHIRPHAQRGDREAVNLVVLCWHHHVQFDRGCLRFVTRTDGGVTFENVDTGEIFEPRASRSAADVLPDETDGATASSPRVAPAPEGRRALDDADDGAANDAPEVSGESASGDQVSEAPPRWDASDEREFVAARWRAPPTTVFT